MAGVCKCIAQLHNCKRWHGARCASPYMETTSQALRRALCSSLSIIIISIIDTIIFLINFAANICWVFRMKRSLNYYRNMVFYANKILHSQEFLYIHQLVTRGPDEMQHCSGLFRGTMWVSTHWHQSVQSKRILEQRISSLKTKTPKWCTHINTYSYIVDISTNLVGHLVCEYCRRRG